MFGALNRFIARLDSEPQPQKANTQNAFGFQVLRNSNGDLPLEPWYDFVIGINGRTIDSPDPNLFSTEVHNCAGSTISFGVWSAKGQRIRELYVPVPCDPPSLGLSLQWTPLSSTEDVWHILDITPDSPADKAGLLPYSDYITGSPEALVRGESGLSELVDDYLNRPLRLFVYNHEYSVTRLITITPSRSWGGSGALGCVLGFGALHRLPAPLDEPPQAPGETLFETVGRSGNEEDRSIFTASANAAHMNAAATPELVRPLPQASPRPLESSDFLIPANMPSLTSPQPGWQPPAGVPSAAGQSGRGKKQRAHHVLSPSKAIDEYFKEGEQKSREQDYSPRLRAEVLPPPPPKGGAMSAGVTQLPSQDAEPVPKEA